MAAAGARATSATARNCTAADALDSNHPMAKLAGGGGGGGGSGTGAISGPESDSPAESPAAGASSPTVEWAEAGRTGGRSAGEVGKGSVIAGYFTDANAFR